MNIYKFSLITALALGGCSKQVPEASSREVTTVDPDAGTYTPSLNRTNEFRKPGADSDQAGGNQEGVPKK